MKYIVLPKGAIAGKPEEALGLSLGGCFYDYLRSSEGRLVGVRYWVIERVKFDQHSVYSQFFDDERFVFDQLRSCVDIVFSQDDVALLQEGRLMVDAAQEFGGEGVVKYGMQFAIVFSLVDEVDGENNETTRDGP